MEYRREVDGLRAVAVLTMILFHAGHEAFSGGFVGVDVFFVISGYLITSIIISEKERDTFSLVKFYERRARRILPALFFVILCCIPFAWSLLLPSHYEDFSQSILAVLSFASNFLFWAESGYFDTAAELKPLLHTWSLAVEEQFYLIFPLLLMLVWSKRKRWLFGALLAIAFGSFALAEVGSQHRPSAAFFLLPTRAWELAIGALIAVGFFYKKTKVEAVTKNRYLSEGCSLLGIGLVLFAVFTFDRTTSFPGHNALIPVVGSGLLIVFANPENLVGRLLGTRICVGIGLISYSSYLWHYPIFVFARHRSPVEPGFNQLLALSVLSIFLGFLSWRYVETPFRVRGKIDSKSMVKAAGFCSTFLFIFGMAGHVSNGFENRYSSDQLEILSLKNYDSSSVYSEGTCFLLSSQGFSEFAPECVPVESDHPVLIWGDSHAAALSYGLRSKLGSVVQYTASACPPIQDAVVGDRPYCKDINDYVLREIERIQPGHIILHANWLAYGWHPSVNIFNTLKWLAKVVPKSKVTIVGSVPQWPTALPDYLLSKNIDTLEPLLLPMEDSKYEELLSLDEKMQLAASLYGADFISPVAELCENNRCPAVVASDDGPKLTAWDYSHLTAEGSVIMAAEILENTAIAPSSVGPDLKNHTAASTVKEQAFDM